MWQKKYFINRVWQYLMNTSLINCICSALRLCSLPKTYFSLQSSRMLKPSFCSVSAMAKASFGGGCSATFRMPAFSANGLYFAMTAGNSTQGVPAKHNVSCTSLAPKPMVRYFGCTTTRLRRHFLVAGLIY